MEKGNSPMNLLLKFRTTMGAQTKITMKTSMKQRIFSIPFHLTSTDNSPRHFHCPPGEKS